LKTLPPNEPIRNVSPTDEQALEALRILRMWMGTGAHSASVVYTQYDLPPDVTSRDAYERRHRALRRAGAPGVWVRGKILASTPEGWSTALPKAPTKAGSRAAPANDVSAAMDRALGIVVVTRAAK